MRKELIVAIIAGILFGVLAAFGIWKANRNFNVEGMAKPTDEVTEITPTVRASASATTPKQTDLTILSPLEYDVVTSSSVPFSGKTYPNSWVVISTDSEDKIIISKEDGTFYETLTLTNGVNFSNITVFSSENKTIEKILPVVYSNTFPNDGTGKPKAYIGVVTDKTEQSLQLKDMKGMISLLSVDPKILTVSRLTDGSQKDASFADVAIGDSIAGLGFVTTSDVLDTKRILLISNSSSDRKILKGTITEVTRKQTVFKTTDNTEYTLPSSNSVSVTEGLTQAKSSFTDLSLDQQIIVTGKLEGTTLSARRVQILE